jgi:putative transposase
MVEIPRLQAKGRSRPSVHRLSTAQHISQIVQCLKGISSRILLEEFPHLREQFWDRNVWARGYLAVSSGTITDEMVKQYMEEQEGKPVLDNSRFPINEP